MSDTFEDIFDLDDVEEDLEEADDLDENLDIEGEVGEGVGEGIEDGEDAAILPAEVDLPLRDIPVDQHYKKVEVVPKNKRRTSSVMTMFEFSETRGMRAKQIEINSPIFIEYGNLSDPISIADAELRAGRNPLTLRRVISDTPTKKVVEEWDVIEMSLPPTL